MKKKDKNYGFWLLGVLLLLVLYTNRSPTIEILVLVYQGIFVFLCACFIPIERVLQKVIRDKKYSSLLTPLEKAIVVPLLEESTDKSDTLIVLAEGILILLSAITHTYIIGICILFAYIYGNIKVKPLIKKLRKLYEEEGK